MTKKKYLETISVAILCSMLIATFNVASFAQSVKTEGVIKSRNGEMMTVQTSTDPNMVVVLTDDTKVAQVAGVLKARRKQMSMAALIPGLAVKVEGNYNDQNQLVASSVSFKGDDLQQAQAIQAGMHETKVQTQQNEAELAKQNAALKAQNDALQQQQAQLTEQQKKLAENKAAIEAATARFGQLDDYYIRDEVTVYFANGKVTVDPKYIPQLTALTTKAKDINGYMIEVKGFASAVGSPALNQKLSEDRASNVVNVLLQQGKVPLTRMLSPGAMGESEQVGSDKTKEGQAENRRVVVRVLQNKAMAGV